MKIGRKPHSNAELDMSAFSDIAFLLIIFFILTTTFIKPFGHTLDIPAGTSDPEQKDQKRLTVNLKGKQIFYGKDGQPVDVDGLRLRLESERLKKKKGDDRLVIVDCADDVDYDHYFQVVMCITQSGGVLALMEEEDGP